MADDKGIDGEKLFEFCEKRLESAESGVGDIYTQTALVMGLMGALGGGLFAVLDAANVPKFFVRLDVFLYYSLCASTAVFLVLGMYHLMGAGVPQQYNSLARVKPFLAKARKLRAGEATVESERAGILDDPMRDHILARMADSESHYYDVNEKRRRKVRDSLKCSGIAALLLSAAALFNFILQCEGMITHGK